jgi:transcriptional regulator with PAS, ATPase and Fis domain
MRRKDKFSVISLWEDTKKRGGAHSGVEIPKFIIESWKRSEEYGVDPLKPYNDHILSDEELNRLINENREWLEIAIPFVEDLAVITQGSGFCITVTDNQGYILKRIGNQQELDFTEYGNFIEGANWSEEVMGTNAVALALIHDKPVQVYGYEHYCKCACLSTCSAAPIHNINGEIIGVLDLTGSYKYVNAHTLGMVEASVKAIERTLELNRVYVQAKKSDILKRAIIESITEGLIAIDSKGVVTHINKHAKNFLEIQGENNIGKHLKDLLGEDNDYFLNLVLSGRRLYGDIVSIKIRNNRKRFVINLTPLKEDEQGKCSGNIVVLYEMKPINKMVNRISGAKANMTFNNLIGESSNFIEAIEQAKMAAQNDANVILLGESGVGKDLFAQSIHNASSRKKETFLAINCAAIPRDLITSELFGYDEGAFTGARRKGNPGKFELADQGTIFLDEIGEIPPDLQATLLRVLEEKTVIRLGGREVIPVNVRLICATNRNLHEEINNGNFRKDLFFRLGVIIITIPSLRERKSDIPLLVDYFVNNISNRLGKTVTSVKPEVFDILLNYDWPGNIRELQNVVERAINLMKSKELTIDLLPTEIIEFYQTNNFNIWQGTPSKENLEEQLIRNYLRRFSNKTEVAKKLQISRSSLYRKMEKYGIKG